jgi:hypothetical protein
MCLVRVLGLPLWHVMAPVEQTNRRPIVFSWRDHLAVHPAAELFPLMSETDPKALQELAEDIKKNGLQQPIAIRDHPGYDRRNPDSAKRRQLVDGRNRLDALALLGWLRPVPKAFIRRIGLLRF